MSLPSNSAQLLASTMTNGRNGNSERESFRKFFECWLSEQNQKLQELISASKEHRRQATVADGGDDDDEDVADAAEEEQTTEEAGGGEDVPELRQLINGVIEHYELYYRAKSRWAKQDVLAMMTPSWRSTLEDAFLWIGGWRPSMAFHLLYSKSGLQLEAQLEQLIRGLATGDLADLSAVQMSQIDELQKHTIAEEKEITEAIAKHQETIVDASMVELAHVVTEMIHENGNGNVNNNNVLQERVDSTLAPKEEGLEEILAKADDLRLRTLKAIMGILNPSQAVHFLIAAAELHLRIHDWGKKRDARRGNGTNGHGTNGHGH